MPKTNLTRSPKKNKKTIHQLMDKIQSSQFKISGLLQLTFLVSKLHSCWRPILGLDKPSLSETIRTSLQQGEWVTSVDFKDAYFHIHTQELVNKVSAAGLTDELREIRAGARTRLQFCRLPVRLQVRSVPTDSVDRW